jgi:hypothetical protein
MQARRFCPRTHAWCRRKRQERTVVASNYKRSLSMKRRSVIKCEVEDVSCGTTLEGDEVVDRADPRRSDAGHAQPYIEAHAYFPLPGSAAFSRPIIL